MRPDGSDARRLVASEASDNTPSWSPDERAIVFVSDRDGPSDVYVVEADGGSPRRLTATPAIERGPVWSPRGRRQEGTLADPARPG
ncbi:MAG TPA: hypothetical protein VMN37_03680 [Gemmatimonadales bacterium]|nr:hypothetical protein [Gemmatimonadales bacterium]